MLINLVNQTGSEMVLAQAYKKQVGVGYSCPKTLTGIRWQVELLNDDKLRYIHFDFHTECKRDWQNVNKLVDKVSDDIEKFG